MSGELRLLLAGLILDSALISVSYAQQTRLLPAAPTVEAGATEIPALDSLSAGAVDAFVAPLSESQTRRLLIDELRRQAQQRDPQMQEGTQGGAVDLIQRLQETSMALSTTTSDLFSALSALPGTGGYMRDQLLGFDPPGPGNLAQDHVAARSRSLGYTTFTAPRS